MKRIIISIAIMVSAAFSSAAQNLDPTVEVSRRYEGKLMDVHKPVMEMAVPDSLYRFDLDFDYSVFDNPYRGSYEFNPYTMDMKPQARAFTPSRFYLNAGAGYTIHPTMDILWSPVFKSPFRMDVYGTHRSYVGDYRTPHVGAKAAKNYFDWGYDLLSKAGVDMGYDWEKVAFDFGASYYGVAVNEAFSKGAYNAADVYFAVKSKGLGKFMYGASLSYRYGNAGQMDEHLFDLAVSVGHLIRPYNRMVIDLGMDFGIYQGVQHVSFANIWFAPRYVREKDGLMTSVGLKVSVVTSQSPAFARGNQYVYPDVRVSYNVIKDAMKLYLNVTGGESINTYATLIDRNHHFNWAYSVAGNPALGSSVERVRPELGIDGRISSHFSYRLHGGYLLKDNAVMDVIVEDGSGYRPGVGYGRYQQAYAGAEWTMDFEAFRWDAAFMYAHTWDLPGLAGAWFVRPAAFKAETSAVYNWNKRVYVGVDCEFASIAKTIKSEVYLPYYVDLGAYAEYAFNKKLSVWLRGGNLLDMEIQRNPLFAEKGINFTAGISLTF